MASTQPTSPIADEQGQAGPKKRRRLLIIFLAFVVVVLLVGWQVVSTRGNNTDPKVAGRPLSNPQTHLHTVAVGDRPGTLYLGTHYGIFTSTDDGRTWPQARGVLNTLMVTTIATSPGDANMLALIGIPSVTGGAAAGTYFSQNGGASWTLRNPPNLSQAAYPYTIVASKANDQHFYVYYLYAGWFETRDMGQHWHPFAQGNLTAMQTPSLLTFANSPNHLLLGGDQGLFESKDDGQTWHTLAAVQGDVYSLVSSKTSPATIFCATDQGLYTWQDGATLIRQLPGTTIFSRLAVDATGKILYGLAARNLWYSQDGGVTWAERKQFQRGDFTAMLLDPQQASRLYIGFFLPAQVVYTSDSGKSWHVLTDSTTP